MDGGMNGWLGVGEYTDGSVDGWVSGWLGGWMKG
jgi:hypothetical protein